MKETALIPIEKLACFVILAESEGVGIDKQCVCFVLAAELLVLHGMTWGMQRGLSTVFFKEALFLNVYKVGYWRKRLEICNRKIADIGFFCVSKLQCLKKTDLSNPRGKVLFFSPRYYHFWKRAHNVKYHCLFVKSVWPLVYCQTTANPCVRFGNAYVNPCLQRL